MPSLSAGAVFVLWASVMVCIPIVTRERQDETGDRRGRLRTAGGLVALGLFAVSSAAGAAEWVTEPVQLPAPASELRQADDGVYVRAGRWFRLDLCGEDVCASQAEPAPLQTERDGIPQGHVAIANEGEGVRRAWYIAPTSRYDHGALGDRIEGGGLAIEDEQGRRFEVILPESEVFEDITPRIADIDRDGRNEVVTIRSSLRTGAAVAVYGTVGSTVIQRAATPPIGQTHRWLNIAGIADYLGNRELDIALVKTPHIGGQLEILSWNRERLTVASRFGGVSNHALGSSELALSVTVRVNADRIPDLVLPSADRRGLRMVTAAAGTIREIASVAMPARITMAIGTIETGPPPILALGLEDGSVVAVRLRQN